MTTLTDGEMVILLHDMARQLNQKDGLLSSHLRQTADRLAELTNKAATRKHWTGHE